MLLYWCVPVCSEQGAETAGEELGGRALSSKEEGLSAFCDSKLLKRRSKVEAKLLAAHLGDQESQGRGLAQGLQGLAPDHSDQLGCSDKC